MGIAFDALAADWVCAVSLDSSGAHAAGVKRYARLIEARKVVAAPADQRRIEEPMSIKGNRQHHLAVRRHHVLETVAATMIDRRQP